MASACHNRTFYCLLVAGMLALLLSAGGCGAGKVLRMNTAETHGKVYYLDGIGCYGFGRSSVPAGFQSAGYRGDVEYWSWSATGTPLDQLGGPLIRARGKDLAELITMYKETYPGRPVSIVGLSGGTGVGVFACEYLPDGVFVDEVILVASSLSSTYDLTGALQHVRGNITLYQTSGDLALGVGARLLGTIDGAPLATSAGLVGFQEPRDLTPEQKVAYDRVINIPYSPAFSALGFYGDHTSAVESASFVKHKMAPLVMAHSPAPGTDGRPPGPLGDEARALETTAARTPAPATDQPKPHQEAARPVTAAEQTWWP